MMWYLIYFCIVLIFYIIFWVNLIRGGELFEKKKFRHFSIIILIPFFLIFLWQTLEFTVQPLCDYIYKPPQIAKMILNNNSQKTEQYTFFVRRKNMEHWIAAYPRNNFSNDFYAYSHIEELKANQSGLFEFNYDTSKIDRIIVAKIGDKMKFTAGTMQALAANLTTIPIQLYATDFDNTFIKRIKPNLNKEMLLFSMYFLGFIGFIYHLFIAWENLYLKIVLIILNLIAILISAYFLYDLARYFLLYMKIF